MTPTPPSDECAELRVTPGDATFADVVGEVLGRGARVRFRASGLSMAPAIAEGDAITVEPVAADRLHLGDVVLCRTARGVVAHRLVSRDRSDRGELVLVLQGDATEECDPPVAPADLLGRVVEAERAGRTVAVSSWRARIAAGLRRAAHRLRARLRP